MLFLLLRWVVLDKVLLPLLLAAPASAIEPQTSNSGATVDGDLLSVTSWHAQTLTNVSWDIPLVRQYASHAIVFYWNQEATEEAWWRTDNVSRAASPPAFFNSSSSDSDLPDFVGTTSGGDEACTIRTASFDSESKNAFSTEAARQHVSVDLVDKRTWWFTATLSQEMPNTTSLTSGVGQASVLLSEPGFYTACLFEIRGNYHVCSYEECVEFTVFQPPYDFLEVGGKLSLLHVVYIVLWPHSFKSRPTHDR